MRARALAALFVVTWAVGVWCCFREQARMLAGPDPHASVERPEWRRIAARLVDERAVVYFSDYEARGKVHGRFWRAQYGLAPVVLLLRYGWKSALRSLEEGESRFLVAEFSQPGTVDNRRRETRALRQTAAARGIELGIERVGDDLLLIEVARGE